MPGLATAEAPGVLSWGGLETVNDSDTPSHPTPPRPAEATPALFGCLWGRGLSMLPLRQEDSSCAVLSYALVHYTVLKDGTFLLPPWKRDLVS